MSESDKKVLWIALAVVAVLWFMRRRPIVSRMPSSGAAPYQPPQPSAYSTPQGFPPSPNYSTGTNNQAMQIAQIAGTVGGGLAQLLGGLGGSDGGGGDVSGDGSGLAGTYDDTGMTDSTSYDYGDGSGETFA